MLSISHRRAEALAGTAAAVEMYDLVVCKEGVGELFDDGQARPVAEALGDPSHGVSTLEDGHLFGEPLRAEELGAHRVLLLDAHLDVARRPDEVVGAGRVEVDLQALAPPPVAKALHRLVLAKVLCGACLQGGDLPRPP
jgi:hypothetical protein